MCLASCTPQPDQREHLVRRVLLPIYSAGGDNSLDLAADRWNGLGGDTKRSTR
jgi:hypothetical protein